MELESAKGHVWKKGRFWYVTYYRDGKRHRKKAGPSKEVALALLHHIQAEIMKEKYLSIQEPIPISFADLAKRYLEDYSRVNKAPRSYRRDVEILQVLQQYFTGNVAGISMEDVEDYKKWRQKHRFAENVLQEREVAATTINKELALLKSILDTAVRWGYLRENPAKAVKLLKESARSKHQIALTPDEIHQLLQACPPRFRPVVVCAVHTGMRRGEILSLQWANPSKDQRGQNVVDLDARKITPVQAKTGEGRVIPMNDTLFEMLKQLRTENPDADYVFPSSRAAQYQNVTKVFNRAVARAGIRKVRFP